MMHLGQWWSFNKRRNVKCLDNANMKYIVDTSTRW
jgi:hypothetical protein